LRYEEGDSMDNSKEIIRYIITNNSQVKEVKVIRVSGEFYTIKFVDTDTVIRVRKSRLYKSKDEALKKIPAKENKIKYSRSPWA